MYYINSLIWLAIKYIKINEVFEDNLIESEFWTDHILSYMNLTSICNALKTNPDYLNQLSHLEKCLNFEISMRQPYLDTSRTKDTLWCKNEIKTTE